MRNAFLTSTWTAAALTVALFAVTIVRADNELNSRNRRGGARSNNDSGRTNNNGIGEKPGTAGGTIINKAGPGNLVPGGAGGANNKKVPDKSAWKTSTKEGWHKDGWNNIFNSQHQVYRHGYWNNGIWIAPWIIANNRP